jgi:hypothetical protein
VHDYRGLNTLNVAMKTGTFLFGQSDLQDRKLVLPVKHGHGTGAQLYGTFFSPQAPHPVPAFQPRFLERAMTYDEQSRNVLSFLKVVLHSLFLKIDRQTDSGKLMIKA